MVESCNLNEAPTRLHYLNFEYKWVATIDHLGATPERGHYIARIPRLTKVCICNESLVSTTLLKQRDWHLHPGGTQTSSIVHTQSSPKSGTKGLEEKGKDDNPASSQECQVSKPEIRQPSPNNSTTYLWCANVTSLTDRFKFRKHPFAQHYQLPQQCRCTLIEAKGSVQGVSARNQN